MKNDVILRCPCCGGNGHAHNDGYWVTPHYVSCEKCALSTKGCTSKDEAVRMWNKREKQGCEK